MRIFAVAVLFLSLIRAPANAESPNFAAEAVRHAAAMAVARAADEPSEPQAAEGDRVEPAAPIPDGGMCHTLQSAALRNDLPVSFLTRLIWQESRFDGHAMSSAGARGVAQFMPETAAELGLADPFDVANSINKSAEFLRTLRERFGNLGLAAAAYNAGPKRVQDWLATGGLLPPETEAYVQIVTGHAANDWRVAQPNHWSLALPESLPCPQLVKLLSDRPESISPQGKPAAAPLNPPAPPVWTVQLTGDPTQAVAMTRYRELQKTYKAILGSYRPLVLSYTGRQGVYWYQVRVAAGGFAQAWKLCATLQAAGGSCLIEPADGRLLKQQGLAEAAAVLR